MKKELTTILEKWDLLKHPFYQAWSTGTLPVSALRTYASEYGAFIEALPEGWLTLQDAATAEEEREHAALWERFAAALGTHLTPPEIKETSELLATSQRLFATPTTALGALYAFEAQQPATAASKLTGLKQHYTLPVDAEPYFEIHAANEHESEKILAAIESLPTDQQEVAQKACEEMAQALWNALSGIYRQTCQA
jgi:pyrroloquinoline-quinone synthase